MSKEESAKRIMNLSKQECLDLSKVCLANADSKYNDALLLSKSGSFGNATSQLMVCMEELMKATVLSLDGNGFQFRQNVKGIVHLFKNHKLRYFLAFAISVFYVFGRDIKWFLIKLKGNPDKFINLDIKNKTFQKQAMAWLINKFRTIEKEVTWFSNADIYRQDGFYVDYIDGVRSPLSITERQFMDFKNRISNFRTVTKEFIFILKVEGNDVEVFKEQVVKLQARFIEDKYYQRLGELVTNLNKRDYDGFSKLSEFVKVTSDKLTQEYKDGNSIFE
jgi:AbiV family abortive infection protein